MRPIFVVRIAAAAALLVASFISLPSFPGAGLFTVNSPAADRAFKGDRLPLTAPEGSPLSAPASRHQQSREKLLLGCDGAFSPIATPLLANVLRRCTV